jgi:hypothetical protein
MSSFISDKMLREARMKEKPEIPSMIRHSKTVLLTLMTLSQH